MAFTHHRSLSICLGIVLAFVLLQLIHFGEWSQAQAAFTSPSVPLSKSCRPNACQGTFYGARNDWMQQVMQRQQYDYYCGVVNILTMDLYDYKKYGQSSPYPTQSSIANLINNQAGVNAISPWGYGGGKFQADISGDTGTEPRAIAFGTYSATPPYYYYHNYIYNPSTPINYYNHPVPTASTYHWTGYWITIEWDQVTAYSEDIALGSNFQPVPHN